MDVLETSTHMVVGFLERSTIQAERVMESNDDNNNF